MRVFSLSSLAAILSLTTAIPTTNSYDHPPFASVQLRQDAKNSSVDSAPNPIAEEYPTSVTGTSNGTILIVPIPYALARSIIPAKYSILTAAYQSLLPNFPAGSYPLIIRTSLDHDVQLAAYDYHLADFQLVKVMFPFVDLLGDGYSAFVFQNYTLVSATSPTAQGGLADYGQVPAPATFCPDLEAYDGDAVGDISFASYVDGNLAFEQQSRSSPVQPWGMNFYYNVTSQPWFGNGTLCESQENFFNTTLSTGDKVPAGIEGIISLKAPLLPKDTVFENVFGIKVDIAFVENTLVPCAQFKGLHV